MIRADKLAPKKQETLNEVLKRIEQFIINSHSAGSRCVVFDLEYVYLNKFILINQIRQHGYNVERKKYDDFHNVAHDKLIIKW